MLLIVKIMISNIFFTHHIQMEQVLEIPFRKSESSNYYYNRHTKSLQKFVKVFQEKIRI